MACGVVWCGFQHQFTLFARNVQVDNALVVPWFGCRSKWWNVQELQVVLMDDKPEGFHWVGLQAQSLLTPTTTKQSGSQ